MNDTRKIRATPETKALIDDHERRHAEAMEDDFSDLSNFDGDLERNALCLCEELERQRDELAEALRRITTAAIKSIAATDKGDGIEECRHARTILARIEGERK